MSHLIVIKCVMSDQNVYYLELDTGLHEYNVLTFQGGSIHMGLRNILPAASNNYEVQLAIRYAKSADELLAILKKHGHPQKMVYELLRVEPIGKRVVLDLEVGEDSDVRKLPERQKARRVAKESIAEVANT